ncbi:MAG: hypothetical protein E7K04_05290 [Helicobacter sp.]|nr:hypothetical protein [Helicobacter sp.]
MIQNVTNLTNLILNTSNNIGDKKLINGKLPLLLDILEKQNEALYKIKIGKIISVSKSNTPLQVGSKYFANVSQNNGALLINNLVPYPKNLEFLQGQFIGQSFQDIKSIFEKDVKDAPKILQNQLLNELANAKNRDDFLHFYHQLYSLQKGIFSFFINDGGKNHLLQIQNERNSLKFYAFLTHLGGISGVVSKAKNDISLDLKTQFQSVADLLNEDIAALKSFGKINIKVHKNIEPIYDFSSHLLDLKG